MTDDDPAAGTSAAAMPNVPDDALVNAVDRLKHPAHGGIIYGSLGAHYRDIVMVLAALDICGKELMVADTALVTVTAQRDEARAELAQAQRLLALARGYMPKDWDDPAMDVYDDDGSA